MTELDYPDTLAIVPACEGNGNTHTNQECHEHGWALINTSEDDGPFLESSYREALEDVVRVARQRVALREGVRLLCHEWDSPDASDPWYWSEATAPLRALVAQVDVL